LRAGKALFLVVLTGLCASLVACGRAPVNSGTDVGGPGLSQEGVARRDAATRWANDYCVAVGSLVDGLATMPSVDPSSPRRAVQTSSDLLASMVGSLDGAVRKLDRLPPSPVDGGDRMRTDTVDEFTGIRDRAMVAKQRLDVMRNATTIDQQTIGAARGPLDEVAKLDVMAGFTGVPELLDASAHAPVCAELTTRGSAGPGN
jgi:hypothetical protein